jgi:hypothetical protein
MIEFTKCAACAEKSGSPPLCPSCFRNRETIIICRDTICDIATNYEMRARNIATHIQHSHTANSQQRKNMEIMYQCWIDAAGYVREKMKRLGIV